MGFDIDELNRRTRGSGIDVPPPVDIKGLIDNIGYQIAFKGMSAVGR
jgi:hypothetical protein